MDFLKKAASEFSESHNQSQNQGQNQQQQNQDQQFQDQQYNENQNQNNNNNQSSGAGGLLGSLSGAFGSGNNNQNQNQNDGQNHGSGNKFLDGLGNKLNEAAGGGQKGEEKEDFLDKGIDFIQEKFLKQGAQNDESAIEQAKDKQIADFVRNQYKNTLGSDFPVSERE